MLYLPVAADQRGHPGPLPRCRPSCSRTRPALHTHALHSIQRNTHITNDVTYNTTYFYAQKTIVCVPFSDINNQVYNRYHLK